MRPSAKCSRNQKIGEIPRLFTYAQLLLAVNKSKARYATAGTPKNLGGLAGKGNRQ